MNTSATSNSFISLVKGEFRRRNDKNRQYSLRSFALALEVSPATLSGILSGKRELTPNMVKRISSGLSLSPHKYQKYLEEIFLLKNGGLPSQEEARYLLSEDQFHIIADWTHFGILRLIKTTGFKANEKWIANRLGVNVINIRESKERLIRVGLLSIKDNRWIDNSKGSTGYTKSENTTAVIKSFLNTMLEKSIESLGNDPIERRSHSGIMMTISDKSIPLARTLIENFRRSMTELMENDQPTQDQVYFLEVGFFPLTKPTNLTNKK